MKGDTFAELLVNSVLQIGSLLSFTLTISILKLASNAKSDLATGIDNKYVEVGHVVFHILHLFLVLCDHT